MYVESNTHHVISLQKNIFVMLNVMDLTVCMSPIYYIQHCINIHMHEHFQMMIVSTSFQLFNFRTPVFISQMTLFGFYVMIAGSYMGRF